MSRHTITVTEIASGRTDTEAVIGYDRPLQTLFLQAFPDEDEEDYPALWLGTDHLAFETLPSLQEAAQAAGYTFMPLDNSTLRELALDVDIDARRKVPDPILDGYGLKW